MQSMFDPTPHLIIYSLYFFRHRFLFFLLTGDSILENIFLVQDLRLEKLLRDLIKMYIQRMEFFFFGFVLFLTHVETGGLVKGKFRKLEYLLLQFDIVHSKYNYKVYLMHI